MKKNIKSIQKFRSAIAACLFLLLVFCGACGIDTASLSEDFLGQQFLEQEQIQTKGAAEESELQVHFIDVGQGDATLLACDGEYMLIDAGDNSKGTTVQAYLQSKGVERLKYVVGTHPDADHIGGLDVIITKFDCDTIFLNGEERDTNTYRDVLDAMTYRGYEMTVPAAGEEYTLGQASFTIEGPLLLAADSNDNSIVIRVEHGKNHFLFSGDAGEAEELDIVSTGRDISADVYKAGHHGSKTSNSEAFLEAVGPSDVVISVGEDNKYGHPSAEVLNRFRAQGISVFRTDEQGGILAVSDGETISFSSSPSESWQAGEAAESAQALTENEKEVKENVKAETDTKESQAAAQIDTTKETQQKEMVHITEGGRKYHKSGCRYLTDSDIEMELEKAIEEGYEPCKVCMKDAE